MKVVAGDLITDNSSEKLFVFHESVSTLQHIASDTVAVQLWHHYLSRAKCSKIQKESYDLFEKVFNLHEDYNKALDKLAELLKTPLCIEKMLKKSLKKIYSETRRWLKDFEYKIFNGHIRRYLPRDFDPSLIVWGQNGNIDGKRSASKMIIYGELNAEQKFILMCAYGMAEELEIFPMSSLPEFFQWVGISDLKIAYWITYHRHDLHEIWLKMPDVIRPEDTSINVTMAKEYGSPHDFDGSVLAHVFEYFWNRLSEAEQLAVALRILPGSPSREIQKIILSTMSPFQQRQLVDQIPLELMAQFCSSRWNMPENAFVIWTRIKDRITEQQFSQFLLMVFHHAMYSEKRFVMMTNVWDTASDRLKRHIAENNPFIILNPLISYSKVPSPIIYRFFMKFLPLVNEHTRKQMFFTITEITIAWVQDIDFLNLCLPKEADQLQLKNLIMESSLIFYCARTLNCLEFDDVINTVVFFSQNARDSGEFFMKLLEADELDAEKFILNYENWNKLSNFIDTVLTKYLSTIPELKKQLVSNFSARAVHCYNDEKENLNALVKITEQVFSSEEMKTFKQTMLEHFQKMISSLEDWIYFKGKCYNALVTWCSDDGSRIIDFRNIIPIDASFDEFFRNTICYEGNTYPTSNLYALDQYLRYFCSTDEEVQLLKIRKYYERDGYWNGEVNRIFPHEIRREITDWFFSVENN